MSVLTAIALCLGAVVQASAATQPGVLSPSGTAMARQRQAELVIGHEAFHRLNAEQQRMLLSGQVNCATGMIEESRNVSRGAKVAATQGIDLPSLGDSYFANKKYRLILIYLTPSGQSTAKPRLVRNPLLPGRVPMNGSWVANWTMTDTVDLHTYTKEALQYYMDKYSYGELDTSDFRIDIPMPNDATPVWESTAEMGFGVVDSVLKRIVTEVDSHYFDIPDNTYQRVGYVFTCEYGGGEFAVPSEYDSLWAGPFGLGIWNGPTFAASAWPGLQHPLWPDANAYSGLNLLAHEFFHHMTSSAYIADRGIWDYGTRTWGFDLMDHNAIVNRERINAPYGIEPLAPVDRYFLGFIKSANYAEITSNTVDVRVKPSDLAPSGSGKILYRIPLTSDGESFIIANHQGNGIDQAYNSGTNNATTRGLEIWHVGKDYSQISSWHGSDVEIAWTIAEGDTYHHPDGQR